MIVGRGVDRALFWLSRKLGVYVHKYKDSYKLNCHVQLLSTARNAQGLEQRVAQHEAKCLPRKYIHTWLCFSDACVQPVRIDHYIVGIDNREAKYCCGTFRLRPASPWIF